MVAMKEVIRYQCEYCSKEFKTPDRHNCKRDPAKKNCYTCQNNQGWEVDTSDEFSRRIIYPTCELAADEGIDAEFLYNIDYDLQCENYKQLENGFTVQPKFIKDALEGVNIF